jgi:uncharacterized lipoprotein YddW (UPF0748 family)
MTIGYLSCPWRHLIKRLVPVALLIFASLGYSCSDTKSSQELRAIWIGADDNSAERIDAVLDRAVQGRFNTVLYYIGCGMVHYRSALLPHSPYVTPEYDPLAYVVEQGHARGLRVQAWWCPGPAERGGQFRDRYPEWDIALVEGIPDDFHWLNFSLPEARRFVGDVVLEIAGNYDVDGVHLDYIRYPSPPPYNDVDCREFFGPDDVSATVQSVYQRLKASRSDVQLTAAVLAGLTAPGNALQYWHDWLAGGYIDCVFPMAYIENPKEMDNLRDYIKEWKGMRGRERIVPGLKVVNGSGANKVPKTPAQFMAEMDMCEANGFYGVVVFDERSITEELLVALAAGTFSP